MLQCSELIDDVEILVYITGIVKFPHIRIAMKTYLKFLYSSRQE
jgi:hypothetical protein